MKKLFLGLCAILMIALVAVPQVFAAEGDVEVKITYLLDDNNQTTSSITVAIGSSYDPAEYDGEDSLNYKFVHYIVNGIIDESHKEGVPFTVGSKLNIIAVYKPINKHVVIYIDYNGEIVKTQDGKLAQYVTSDNTVLVPNVPQRKGYTASWNQSLTKVTENKVVKALYTVDSTTEFTITYDGTRKVKYNDIVTLTNENEVSWLEDGKVVWYGREYKFSALSDRTITTSSPADAPSTPIVSMKKFDADLIRNGHTTYLAQVYVPDGQEVFEVGFLKGITHEVTFDNKSESFVSQLIPGTNEFIVSIPNTKTGNIRAYALTNQGLLEHYSYVKPLPKVSSLPVDQELKDAGTDQPWFDLGAGYNPEGYSGRIRVLYIAEGQKIVFEEVTFASGRLNINKSVWDELVRGITYRIKLQSIGNGISHQDSDIVDTSGTVRLEPLPLSNITNLLINENIVTWNKVTNATGYDIYIDNVLTTTVVDTEYVIDSNLYGNHKIRVVATAPGYTSTEATVDYSKINESAKQLDTPILAFADGKVNWGAINGATRYSLTITGDNYFSEETILVFEGNKEFELDGLYLPGGKYTISVLAVGDGKKSKDSVAGTYIYTAPNLLIDLPSLKNRLGGDFNGDTFNGHGNGAGYDLTVHPDNFLSNDEKAAFAESFILEIEFGNKIHTINVNVPLAGGVIGVKDQLKSIIGSAKGQYVMRFIMVAKPNSGYRNSNPYTVTLNTNQSSW